MIIKDLIKYSYHIISKNKLKLREAHKKRRSIARTPSCYKKFTLITHSTFSKACLSGLLNLVAQQMK